MERADLDKRLYKEFTEGKVEAFEELVLTYKDSLILFVMRYLNDMHASEDIAQDVFAYIFVYKEKYNDKYSFKTFIYTLGKNKAIDYVRKNSRLQALDEDMVITDELVDKVIKNEQQRLVHNAIKSLKNDQQMVVYLVEIDELSYKEAGKVMGKTVSQIKSLLYRAKQNLRQYLEEKKE